MSLLSPLAPCIARTPRLGPTCHLGAPQASQATNCRQSPFPFDQLSPTTLIFAWDECSTPASRSSCSVPANPPPTASMDPSPAALNHEQPLRNVTCGSWLGVLCTHSATVDEAWPLLFILFSRRLFSPVLFPLASVLPRFFLPLEPLWKHTISKNIVPGDHIMLWGCL